MEYVEARADRLLDAEDHCQGRLPYDAVMLGVGPGPDLAKGAARLADIIQVEPASTRDLLHHEVLLTSSDGKRFGAVGGAEVLPTPRPADIARMHSRNNATVARIDAMVSEVDRLDTMDGVGPLMRCFQ